MTAAPLSSIQIAACRPFTYAVTANTIASGVDVDRTSGKMKGTATAITPHTVPPAATITITDALGATTTVSARVQVNAPAPAAPPGYFAAARPDSSGMLITINFIG